MEKRVDLPGSDRRPVSGAKVVGKVDPNQRIEITVQLRRRKGANLEKTVQDLAAQKPSDRQYLTRTELANIAGADPNDIPKIDAFAHEQGLSVTEVSIPRRTVKLSGTIANMSAAFGVKLKRYKAGTLSYRGRTGKLKIPSRLAGIIERVLGLDDRPTLRPRYRVLSGTKAVLGLTTASKGRGRRRKRVRANSSRATSASYTPIQVAAIYSYPAGLDGSGQTIALIELNDVDSQGNPTGAGYSTSDLDTYFQGLGITPPSVTAVGVDGGANVPGKDAGADGEVTLDIEVAGAVAPGAAIAVYFGTNTDDGFIQAITAAIHDDVRKPSIISISWGQAEETSTSQLLEGLDQALQEAAAIGVTVCVAAGDNGSADMIKTEWDHKTHVDFPASSPYALACGGTTLDPSSAPNAPVETVWNRGEQGGATGGGVSNFFAKPAYQSNANVPSPTNAAGGRGVPDVSGNADPFSGYSVLVDGASQVIGGTSAVAPLWAGLLARINQNLITTGGKPAGFVNALLYPTASKVAFHDVTQGNNDIYHDLNGKFPAGPGWDPCTGMGTPDGAQLMALLSGQSTQSARRAGA
jgi:kumamolisin